MPEDLEREPTLAEMEEEVLAEGREWTRLRLQQKPQERADGISQGGRLVRCQRRKLTLESSVGPVQIETDYGQEGGGGQWVCPQRQAWGIQPHQKMTPGLQDRLCFTVTMTGSYESAAQVAGKWGCAVDDSKLHALVQRVGAQAEKQMRQRIKHLPKERRPERKASELGVLLVDGWQVRHRGPGWGAKKRRKTGWNGTK